VVADDLDTREPGRLLIAADGDDISAGASMVEQIGHQQNDQNDPQKANRQNQLAQLDAEDAAKPPAHLALHRPGDAQTADGNGSNAAADHHGAQRGDKGRQLEHSDEKTIEAAKSQTRQQCCQHRHDHRAALLQQPANQGITDHTCAQRQVNAAGNDDEGGADRHECNVIGIAEQGNQRGITAKRRAENAEQGKQRRQHKQHHYLLVAKHL